jgi:2-polyprenyl-6-methoxyphenol hydroxylase-like FAD-dependent oxidoreductase
VQSKILVVGAGPVGLTLALQLARMGVRADLVDKGIGGSSYSKALSVSAATLKTLHGLGLSTEFQVAGKPIRDIEIFYDGARCAHIDKRRLGGLYDYYLSLAQPETELLLRIALERLGKRVRYAKELVSLQQNPHAVVVDLKDTETGFTETLEYDFVVGCDGAQSAVRKLSGIAFDGVDYDVHFVMGDVHFETACDELTTSYHVFDDGFLIFLPMSGGLTRLVVSRPGKLPDERPAPGREELQAYLDRYHRQGLTIRSVQWSSGAKFFDRLASTNRLGRIFLAGDAFHLFSPIGGQGMNTGIQDAMNLSWKLAYAVRGDCKAALLDSYRSERYAAVEKVSQLSRKNTDLILGRCRDHDARAHYVPSMANRRFMRRQMAQQFAGFLADYREVPESLVGQHIPYFEFSSPKAGFKNSYEIPLGKRNILFTSVDDRTGKFDTLLESYSHVITVRHLSSMQEQRAVCSMGLSRSDVCIVRPDGYIGFHGSFSDCERYLEGLYPRAPVLMQVQPNT